MVFNPVRTRGALLGVLAVLLSGAASSASAQTVWSNRDVGRPAEGSIELVDDTTMLMAAAGTGIGGTADQFHFTYQHFYGDVDMVVRIDSVTKADADMQAGIMFRSTLGGQAKNVALLYSPLTGVVLQSRGDLAGSEPLLREAIATWKRVLIADPKQETAQRVLHELETGSVGTERPLGDAP